jgi:competence protein ComEC
MTGMKDLGLLVVGAMAVLVGCCVVSVAGDEDPRASTTLVEPATARPERTAARTTAPTVKRKPKKVVRTKEPAATRKPSRKARVRPTRTTAAATSFKNCTALNAVHPDGVPKGHPAYASRHDRDRDNWACEKN